MGPAANKATSFAGRLSATCCSSSYHDGQFWVGLAEHVEDGRHGVARIVFGAEPSDEEILRFVVDKWEKLSFFDDEAAETSKPAKNPIFLRIIVRICTVNRIAYKLVR